MGLIIASKRHIQSSVWVMDHVYSPKIADLRILTRCNGGVYNTEPFIAGRRGLVSILDSIKLSALTRPMLCVLWKLVGALCIAPQNAAFHRHLCPFIHTFPVDIKGCCPMCLIPFSFLYAF